MSCVSFVLRISVFVYGADDSFLVVKSVLFCEAMAILPTALDL